jgi:hypothetical protein
MNSPPANSNQLKNSIEIHGINQVSIPSRGGETIMNEMTFDIPIHLSLLILALKSSSDSFG